VTALRRYCRTTSGIIFDNTYGSGVTPEYRSAIVVAENFFQSHFINSVTLSMSFSLGPTMNGAIAQNYYSAIPVSYVNLETALRLHATSPDDRSAVRSLPLYSPTADPFAIAPGLAQVLGIIGDASGYTDQIVLNNGLPWAYGADVVGTLEHEISEGALGRIGGLGTQGWWGPMDLFRYSAIGQHDYTGGKDDLATFFSVDGNSLLTQFHDSLNQFGTFDGLDLADWDHTVGDAFGPGNAGVPAAISETDLRVMDILGWTPTPNPIQGDFDPAYYLAQNPDVAAANVDPLMHYETYGWEEGRNPDAYFNTRFYLNQNPDVAAAGIDPLLHYETYGWKEGRDPSLNFNTDSYLKANPDVAAANIDPLEHYLQFGASEGRMTFISTPHGVGPQNSLVDNAYYSRTYGDVAAVGMNPFTHYDQFGWHEGRNPDALFDTKYYLAHNPDVAAAGVDPLLHYEEYGWHEGRDPSAQFSTNKYLAANPDVAAAGIDPLVHYEQYGIQEGRAIFSV
jgi:hypothetical protein